MRALARCPAGFFATVASGVLARWLLLPALLGLVTAAVLAFGSAAQGAGPGLGGWGNLVQCTPIKGPTWVFPPDTYSGSDLFDTDITSDLYESFAINFSCAKAASIIKAEISQTLPNTTPEFPNRLTLGGFSCVAYPDKNGQAYGGECRSGAAQFDWNYNVLWRALPKTSGGEGGVGIEPMGMIEYTTVLRPLGNGHYQLLVENSSRIGAIRAFSWTPPPGLTLTAVTGSAGANCSLANGSISCSGNVQPPQCLCNGSGGTVTIGFDASGDAPSQVQGRQVNQGIGFAYLRISAMTPVPYLIPETPQSAASNRGV